MKQLVSGFQVVGLLFAVLSLCACSKQNAGGVVVGSNDIIGGGGGLASEVAAIMTGLDQALTELANDPAKESVCDDDESLERPLRRPAAQILLRNLAGMRANLPRFRIEVKRGSFEHDGEPVRARLRVEGSRYVAEISQESLERGDGFWLASHELEHTTDPRKDRAPAPPFADVRDGFDASSKCFFRYYLARKFPALRKRSPVRYALAERRDTHVWRARRLRSGKIAVVENWAVEGATGFFPRTECRVQLLSQQGVLERSFVTAISDRTEDNGKVCYNFVEQPDGGVVVTGLEYAVGVYSVAYAFRLTPDWTVDTSWGNSSPRNGEFRHNFGRPGEENLGWGWSSGAFGGGVSGPGGELYLGGRHLNSSNVFNPIVVKLTAGGALDTTGFGDNGFIRIEGLGANMAQAGAMALTPEGHLVFTVDYNSVVGGASDRFRIYLSSARGQLAQSFGGNGVGYATTSFLTGSAQPIPFMPSALYVDAEGNILLGGKTYGVTHAMAFVRFTSTGQLDGRYQSGRVTYSFGDFDHWIQDIVPVGGGKLLVGGSVARPEGNRLAMLRLNADGSLDETFREKAGGPNLVVASFRGGVSLPAAFGRLDDGRYFVVGKSMLPGETPEHVMATYYGDAVLR